MTKKKKEEIILFDCKDCKESVLIDDALYCKMRLKNIFEITDFAKTDKKEDCGYFRKKSKSK